MSAAGSCFVVGAGIVPLRCLELLAERGFEIRGFFSQDGSLQASGWRHAPSLDALRADLLSEPFDYLFSINNAWLIPQAVLAQARRAAINYPGRCCTASASTP